MPKLKNVLREEKIKGTLGKEGQKIGKGRDRQEAAPSHPALSQRQKSRTGRSRRDTFPPGLGMKKGGAPMGSERLLPRIFTGKIGK